METIDKNLYTPMMRQYLTIKEDYGDSIVFFRLGDFYEMFFSDALVASKELEITLTGRDAGGKEKVPMCGVPHHSAQSYIEKLVDKGFKVAICEQVEDASVAKGIVKRDVVKLITPGTIMENGSINEKGNNFICAISEYKNNYTLSYSDLSTGENYITTIPKDKELLENEILNLGSKEIIISSKFNKKLHDKFIKAYDITVSINDETKVYEYLSHLVSGINNKDHLETFGRLLNYLLKTQKRELMHLQKVSVYETTSYLRIDNHSKRNLELTETLRTNSHKGSLLWLIDKCETAMGSRYLKKNILRPLISQSEIEKRYDIIDSFHKNYLIKEDIRSYLKNVYDLERIVGRVAYGNSNARDLVQLLRSLEVLPSIKEKILSLDEKYADELGNNIDTLNDLTIILKKSLVDDPPFTIKEGGIIKPGYNEELDEIKYAATSNKEYLAKLEQSERERTGIKKLKVGFNRVFGYYIEITKGQIHLLKDEFGYTRKQTLSNSERFITPILKEKEAIILGSEEKSIKLEYELFLEIRDITKTKINTLQTLAKIISEIDMLQSFATVADENRFTRPVLTNDFKIDIKNGRHPVVEKVLIDEKYVENDIYMDEFTNILLITGPNMSGKSTYMRQLALIVVMAQIGCFVPCEYATFPIYDQIFTRIGAADDLVSGQSTFMVEMLEANNAISNATKNSLILFDEIGRGTATYDGMALAQAIIEYIHEKIGCKTLFSTHYHELTDLDESLNNLKNVHVSAEEVKGNIIFLHKIKNGPSDKSYGINVAQLAKLPKGLIERSKRILTELEKNHNSSSLQKLDLNLFNFDDYQEEIIVDNHTEVIDLLSSVDINEITPIEALNTLNELIKKL